MNIELLQNSAVGRDFLKSDNHPNTDTFLDYRLRLMEMRKEKKYPDVFYAQELDAIDEIIRVLNDSASEGN